jgi:hypothetical protein
MLMKDGIGFYFKIGYFVEDPEVLENSDASVALRSIGRVGAGKALLPLLTPVPVCHTGRAPHLDHRAPQQHRNKLFDGPLLQ